MVARQVQLGLGRRLEAEAAIGLIVRAGLGFDEDWTTARGKEKGRERR